MIIYDFVYKSNRKRLIVKMFMVTRNINYQIRVVIHSQQPLKVKIIL